MRVDNSSKWSKKGWYRIVYEAKPAPVENLIGFALSHIRWLAPPSVWLAFPSFWRKWPCRTADLPSQTLLIIWAQLSGRAT